MTTRKVALPLNRFYIRLASLSDLPAICAIENDSFPEPYSASLLERLLKDCSESFFVAAGDAEELVGYCVSSLSGKSAHMISIAVNSSFRSKGIATALLQRSIVYLMAHGVDEFWLEVNLKNVEAVTLYTKLGFEEVGVLKDYYSDGSDAVRMCLVLRKPTPKATKEGG
jgi:ribosomal-protein-alanine N-acetyltransferase